jgi:hypothetical protein
LYGTTAAVNAGANGGNGSAPCFPVFNDTPFGKMGNKVAVFRGVSELSGGKSMYWRWGYTILRPYDRKARVSHGGDC